MRNFSLFIFVFILVVFQLSVLDVFFGSQKSPNVVLAFIVCLAVLLGFKNNLGWIVFSGLLLDAGAGWLWGTSAVLFVLIAWIVDSLNFFSDFKSLRRLVLFPSLAIIFALATFFFDWAGLWIFELENHFWTKQEMALSFHSGADFFWKAIFTALSGLVLYSLMKRMRGPENRTGFGSIRRPTQ